MIRLISGILVSIMFFVKGCFRWRRRTLGGLTIGSTPAGAFRHAVVVDRLPNKEPRRPCGVGYSRDAYGRFAGTPERGERMDFYIPMFDQPIADIEDIGFSALAAATDPATGVSSNARITVDGSLDRDSLLAGYAEIKKHGRRVARLFMNPCEYFDIRYRASGQTAPKSSPDGCIVATLWGADIIVSRSVPEGTVYVCADKEYVGVMIERRGAAVGLGIHNPRGVASVTVMNRRAA